MNALVVATFSQRFGDAIFSTWPITPSKRESHKSFGVGFFRKLSFTLFTKVLLKRIVNGDGNSVPLFRLLRNEFELKHQITSFKKLRRLHQICPAVFYIKILTVIQRPCNFKISLMIGTVLVCIFYVCVAQHVRGHAWEVETSPNHWSELLAAL